MTDETDVIRMPELDPDPDPDEVETPVDTAPTPAGGFEYVHHACGGVAFTLARMPAPGEAVSATPRECDHCGALLLPKNMARRHVTDPRSTGGREAL